MGSRILSTFIVNYSTEFILTLRYDKAEPSEVLLYRMGNNYIREFQFGTADDIAQATTQRIRLTSDIKIIDLYHFGWNIGAQYKKSGLEIAQFLKNVFAEKLYDTEVTTIVRKSRMSGTCRIKIKPEI